VLPSPERPSHYRGRELNSILSVLNDRRPAVVTLTGGPGMGKTSLIDAVRIRAASRGWQVAGGGEHTRLAVDPGTRAEPFRQAVLGSFREPDDTRVVRARRADAVAIRGHAARFDPFVDELARLSPVLLLIDDYRPSPTFAEWFEGSFLRAVRGSRMPVVVLIAPPDPERQLVELATDPIELDPLDPDVVRAELKRLNAALEPPLGETELEVYVREVNTPQLLDSLTHVLALASRHEGEDRGGA
jgi:hypothetical protein